MRVSAESMPAKQRGRPSARRRKS